jgi:hypothetical protein
VIEKHRAQLRALDDDSCELVARLLGVATEPLLIEALEARGLCQADVVMALLHPPPDAPVALVARTLGTLVQLVRAAAPAVKPLPRVARLEDPDEWWVCAASRNLRLPVTAPSDGSLRDPRRPMNGHAYWRDRNRVRTASIRVYIGLTVRALLLAGVARADVDAARRAGRLRLEGIPRSMENRDEREI